MKKNILFVVSFLVVNISAYTQSLSLTDTLGADITGDTLTVSGTTDITTLTAYVYITNNSASSINVKVRKKEISIIGGSVNYFCWGLCFGPTVYESPNPISIPSGATNNSDFYGDYLSNGNVGTSIIAYTFFDSDSPKDTARVTVKYIGAPIIDIGVVAIDAPVSGCGLTATEEVTVRVANFVGDTVTSIPVAYSINGGSQIIQVFTNPILPPGDTVSYTYATGADLSVPGIYIFDAWTSLVGDVDNTNDSTVNYSVTHILAPAVNLGNDTTVCISILLDVTTGGATYNWSDGSTNPTLSVSTSGTYWVDVTVGGCTTRDSIDIIVNSGPPVVNLGPDTTVCGGIVLDGGANPGATFAWSTGDTTQTIFVSISGTYSVDVTNACTAVSDTITITVIPVPVVDLGNDTIICPGDTIILDATTAGVAYIWSTGDTVPTISVNTTGTYSVVLTDTATWCTANDTIVVIVSSGPTANFSFTAIGLTVTFDATSSVDATSFFWDFGDSIGTSTQDTVTYTYAAACTYDVKLIAINPCGSDTITIPVTVTTGIAENNIATEQINVYPNPAGSFTYFSYNIKNNSKAYIAIHNVLGSQLKKIELTGKSGKIKINTDRLTSGLYFYSFVIDDKVIKTKKLLICH